MALGWASLHGSPHWVCLSVCPLVCMVLEGGTDLFILPTPPIPSIRLRLDTRECLASSAKGPKFQLLMSGKGSGNRPGPRPSHDFKLE